MGGGDDRTCAEVRIVGKVGVVRAGAGGGSP
jgi:hypothetical protein